MHLDPFECFLGVADGWVLAQEDADNSLPGYLTQRRKRFVEISGKWSAYAHCQLLLATWYTLQIRDEKVVE